MSKLGDLWNNVKWLFGKSDKLVPLKNNPNNEAIRSDPNNGYVSTNYLRDTSAVSSSVVNPASSAATASKLFDAPSNASLVSGSSGRTVSTSSVSKPVYVDAPLAEKYKMGSAAAYQEALANTAHQREIEDLKAAGLNPVLSASGGNGAAVFSADLPVSASSASHGSGSSASTGSIGDLVGDVYTAVTGRSGRGYAIGRLVDRVASSPSAKAVSNFVKGLNND